MRILESETDTDSEDYKEPIGQRFEDLKSTCFSPPPPVAEQTKKSQTPAMPASCVLDD